MGISDISKYGVLHQAKSDTEIEFALESLRHLGFAVIDGGYSIDELELLSDAFERAKARNLEKFGRDALTAVDEHNTIRLPLAYEPMFLELATNTRVLEICRQLISDYFVLNQQNGIINPPFREHYNQGSWHRDLPYQHFVSSRPLAINALFCIDRFTTENGATRVLPASHKREDFPSDRFVDAEARTIEAPKGAFIVLDCMLYHTGGANSTECARRAVNHVYTIPMLQQQIHIPSAVGDSFVLNPDLRRLLGYGVPRTNNVAEFILARGVKK